MKLRHFIPATLILSLQLAASAKDYSYFITDDGNVFQDATNGTRFIRLEKIEQAKQAPESRPAALDPEDNWGQPVNDMQTSLRFSKAMFSTNEAIIATLMVRNATDAEGLLDFARQRVDAITVIGPGEKALERTDIPRDTNSLAFKMRAIINNPEHVPIAPGMQRKFELDLKPFFDFGKPGRYILYARSTVFDYGRKSFNEIQSGNAVIILTNSFASTVESPGTNASN